MKSFKSIREGNSVEPGVSEIDDAQEDPLSFVEIKPKKTKIVKEAMSKDDMSSVALQSMVAKKNLQQTAGKNKSQAFVDKMVSKANAGDRLPKRPNDEYDRKVTGYLKKKYNEETVVEANIQPTSAKSRTHIGNLSHPITNSVVHPSSGKEIGLITKQPNGNFHAHHSAAKLTHSQSGTFDSKDKAHQFIRDAHAKATKNGALSDRFLKSKPLPHLAKEETEQMDEKVTSRDIKMAVGVAKDKRYAGGNMSGAVKTMEKMKPGLSKHPRVQQVLKSTQEGFDKLTPQQKAHQYNLDSAQREIDRRHGEGEDMTGAKVNKKTYEITKPKKQNVSEGIDLLKIWNGIKPVHEEIKTTHEDPLVVTKDEDGHIHTHANLSVANAIHGTNVKHQAIHTGKPVQGGKFTFQISKHHEGALKEDAPFDPVAHKKELDKLMGKHMAAHTETSKLISAKAPQEAINKAQERNNAVKAEIRAHKDKVPKSPAKKDGGPGDYYASKKPGEYTGD